MGKGKERVEKRCTVMTSRKHRLTESLVENHTLCRRVEGIVSDPIGRHRL